MTHSEFIEIIRAGERNGVEFKSARERDKTEKFHEVVRAVLGMANRRDGGVIILGVHDNGDAPGLTDAQLESWSNRDLVRAAIAPYADPFVDFRLELIKIDSGELAGRRFVLIRVDQFMDIPVICGKAGRNSQGETILRLGALYVRSRETEATVEVSTQAQMRELITLAVERGARALFSMNQAVGIAPTQSDEEQFAKEREGFENE